METDKKIILSNPNNIVDPNLSQFPLNAREDVLTGIDMKMYDFMRSCNSDYDSLTAINYLGKKFTYDDVFDQIERYAKAFKAYGIQKGDYVSVMLPNIPELIYIKFALNRIGAVANIFDPRVYSNTALEYINNSNSKMLITVLDKYEETVKPILNKLKVEDVFCVSPLESISLEDLNIENGMFNNMKTTGAFFLYQYKELLLKAKSRIRKDRIYCEISNLLEWEKNHTGTLDSKYVPFDPATVLYTSGTTGTMKGAVTSNEAYNAIYKNLQYGVKNQTPGEKFCGIIPFFTSYGSGAGMFNSMCNRFEMFLYPKFHPNDFVKIVESDKPNVIIGVPKFYDMLINSDTNIDSINQVVIGGDKILPEKAKQFRDYFNGKQVIIGYGESEFLGVLSVTLDGIDNRLDSSGVPLPGVKVKIVNPETKEEVPFLEEGEAYFNSISMMLDYLNKHDEVEKLIAYDEEGNKYYGSGDKMYITPDGQLCFVDRYKRLMKRPDGHQVNANPIEKLISENPEVIECCVVGLKYKDVSGVIPTAFVAVNDQVDKKMLVEKFEQQSVEKLPSFREKALAYVFVDKLPISKMGKIDAFQLAKFKLEDLDAIITDYTFIDKNDKIKKSR